MQQHRKILPERMELLLSKPLKNKVDIENKLNKASWYLMKIKNKNEI